jgi:hypothetical protein
MAYTTINKSTDYFNTKLYDGNGSSTHAITGVGYQPDWVWIKKRDGVENHFVFDAVRGQSKYIYPNSTAVEGTSASGVFKTFDSDGFTVANNDGVNENNKDFVSWNWKANGAGSANTDGSINSTVSANTTAGFSIVKYNGSGTAGTVGHGLGAVPKMIIIKEISGNASGGNQSWSVYHQSTGNDHITVLNGNNAKIDDVDFNDTTPTSSVFSVGVQNRTNSSNGNGVYIAYCFAEKAGYSKFGSYTGNGNADGSFIYTGFKPAFVIIKNTAASTDWILYDDKRGGPATNIFGNPNKYFLRPNTSDIEGNETFDMYSNGFKPRITNNFLNGSGNTMIYMAFGQSLVGSNNVPCTAR